MHKLIYNDSSLIVASLHGRVDVVKEVLLDNDAQVNLQGSQGQSSLMIASQEGHAEMVMVLLENDAQVNLQCNHGQTSLMMAIANNHADVVKVLLANNANIHTHNIHGASAIDIARHYKHNDIISLLVPLEEEYIPLDSIKKSIKHFQEEYDMPKKPKPSFLLNFDSPKY